MSKPFSFQIICPLCNKVTEVTILKSLNKEEYKEDLEFFASNTDDMVLPEMSKEHYGTYQQDLKEGETTMYVIGKIKSHKLGLLEKCFDSDKMFKILLYFFVNHKEKTSGFTFRIGQQVKYSIEILNMAESWAKYCTTLGKESISIILEMLVSKNCIFTGDIVMLTQVDPDIRGENWKFQCITANSSMKPNDLRTFINVLRDRLEDNGEEVRAKVSDTLCIIECFKNDKWYQCVAVAPKGYSID